MSVHVTEVNGTTWHFVHDEGQHEADADSSTVSYGEWSDGSPNPDIVIVPCPVEGCEGVSSWPRETLLPEMLEALP